ncbi:response regulator transcription factor [Kurthia huakuii]|uniref:response regulator transcription factor n=1 Tax=Kurthia huakuii TaxID=1421019 RepID=UPI00049838B8|nr:response regulator transcription factor [Kurthia huakuii]MBM7698596.1 two-component system OmpR family response regulator [Kurthia huakuii]
MIKILVIDDEESITQFLQMGLEAEQFDVVVANDGMTGVQQAKNIVPDVAIVDIMMPGMDGYEVCHLLKKHIGCQVILLSAKGEVEDRIKGLNALADDYMTKPFSFEELLARIHARLRNVRVQQEEALLTIDEKQKQIRYRGEPLLLTRTEYKLLHYFIEHPQTVLSKEAILNAVWGYDYFGSVNVVEVYMKTLRQKLGDTEHTMLQTVRGFGYKLDVPV